MRRLPLDCTLSYVHAYGVAFHSLIARPPVVVLWPSPLLLTALRPKRHVNCTFTPPPSSRHTKQMADADPGPSQPRATPAPSQGPPPTPPVGASLTAAGRLAPKPSITSIQSADSGPSLGVSAKPSLASLASTKGLLGASAPIAGAQGPKKGGLEDVPESPASPRQEKRWGSLGAGVGGSPRAPGAGAGAGAGKSPGQGGAPEKAGYKKRLLTFLVREARILGYQ